MIFNFWDFNHRWVFTHLFFLSTHLLFVIQQIEIMLPAHKQTEINLQLYHSFFLSISTRGWLDSSYGCNRKTSKFNILLRLYPEKLLKLSI